MEADAGRKTPASDIPVGKLPLAASFPPFTFGLELRWSSDLWRGGDHVAAYRPTNNLPHEELKKGSTDLGWDPVKRTVDTPEEWWAERLAVVPAAKKFKLSEIEPELEEKLDRMFGRVVATGNYACSPSETVLTTWVCLME